MLKVQKTDRAGASEGQIGGHFLKGGTKICPTGGNPDDNLFLCSRLPVLGERGQIPPKLASGNPRRGN